MCIAHKIKYLLIVCTRVFIILLIPFYDDQQYQCKYILSNSILKMRQNYIDLINKSKILSLIIFIILLYF